MKNRWMLLFAASLMLSSVACQKEEIDTPIWFPGEQTYGFAKGEKNGKDFEASVYFHRSAIDSLFALKLHVYSIEGFLREEIAIGIIPLRERTYFELAPTRESGKIRVSFSTFQSDGDVAGDSYVLDTSAKGNRLVVSYIDSINTEIKGCFTASLLYRDGLFGYPRSSKNPDRITFSNVCFEARLFN